MTSNFHFRIWQMLHNSIANLSISASRWTWRQRFALAYLGVRCQTLKTDIRFFLTFVFFLTFHDIFFREYIKLVFFSLIEGEWKIIRVGAFCNNTYTACRLQDDLSRKKGVAQPKKQERLHLRKKVSHRRGTGLGQRRASYWISWTRWETEGCCPSMMHPERRLQMARP